MAQDSNQKSILDKLLNGKTSAGSLVAILIILGLNSLGIGGGGRAATPQDLNTILAPMTTKMYERTEQFQRTQAEIIENQKQIIELLQGRSQYFERITIIQTQLLDEIKEMRRGRP